MSKTFDPYHKWLGIRPEEQPPNHYRLLGLHDFEDDPAAIENAADQRMAYLKTHQTGKNAAASQKLLNEIVAAKLCLLDIDAKVAYDATLRQRFTGARPPTRPPMLAAAAVASRPPPLEARAEPAELDQPTENATPADDTDSDSRFPAKVVLWVAGSVALGAMLLAFAGSIIWRHLNRDDGPMVTQEEEYVPPPPAVGINPVPEPNETADTPNDDNLPSDDINTDRPETNNEADEPSPDVELDEETALEIDEDPDDLEVTPPDLDIPPPDVNETEETVDPPPVVNEPPSVPVATRLPVPEPDTQRTIATQIEEVYPPASYTSSLKKVELAKELLKLGQETLDSADERFVLYRRAMEVACDAGNTAIMLAAIRAIGADYDVDAQDVQIKMLQKYVGDGQDPARVFGLLKASQELVARAMADREYQFALQVSTAACHFCDRPVGGSQFRQSIRDDHGRIERTLEAYNEFTQAREKLESAPTDAQANLLAGRWYCFLEDDWDHGLPCLVRGADDRLREVARQDLAVETGRVESVLAAADAWWALAQERSDDEQIALAQRALHWQSIFPPSRLLGIRGATAETRKKEIESLLAKSKYSLWRTTDHPVTDSTTAEAEEPETGDFKEMFSQGMTAAIRETDFVAAERWFSRCSKLQPNHVPTLNNYALVSVRMRDFRRAISLWEKAVELAPSRSEFGHNLKRFRSYLAEADFRLDASLNRSLLQVAAEAASSSRSSYSTGWLYLPIDDRGGYGNRAIEDDRCMFCAGAGDVECPAPGCSRGRVRSTRTDIVGRNTITGAPITRTVPIRVPCSVCRGRGKVDCSHCTSSSSYSRY